MDYLNKLIALRIDHDLSQKEAGKIIDKSQQGYDHIEKRRAKLAIEDFKNSVNFIISAQTICWIKKQLKGKN